MEQKIEIKEKMRDTVELIMADGTVMSGPRHTPLVEFMRVYQDPDKPLIVGAIVNNDLRELTFPIFADAAISPINMSDSDGARIYRRSLTFLLEVAFLELFSDWRLTIQFPLALITAMYQNKNPSKKNTW